MTCTYHKDLVKDHVAIHLKECGWYINSTFDSKVSFLERFELNFAKKLVDVQVSKGLKKSREASKNKGKDKARPFKFIVE
jgi:hypothetical protein